MLQSVVKSELTGHKAHCRFKCDTEFGCKHCVPSGMSLSCPASSNSKAPCLPIEWIADTGSAQDLIAERELGQATPFESASPISMMTANGPNSANQQCDISVDSIGVKVAPYVLPETPSVLSIGQRCMDEGFDFVWRANSRPYLRSSEGKKVFMDVKDNVPYLKAWPENISVPAKRVENPIANTKVSLKSSATGRLASPCSEELAKSLRESGDFSHASCYKLLKSARFKASKNKRSIITSDPKSPESETEYVVLGAFCHGGMQGITSRSHQNKELSKYLNRYLTHHGAKGPSTSICINHGSSIRMHKDSHNHREYQNNTLCLGDHSGGELWIHDPEADPKSKRYHSAKAKDGTKLPGKLHVTKHRVLTFNPKTYHAVRPWKGDRWSITSYVNRAVRKLDSEQLAQLKEYGFHVPSKVSAPSSLLVSPEDKEKTLFDLVSDGIDKELAADLAKLSLRAPKEKRRKQNLNRHPQTSRLHLPKVKLPKPFS